VAFDQHLSRLVAGKTRAALPRLGHHDYFHLFDLAANKAVNAGQALAARNAEEEAEQATDADSDGSSAEEGAGGVEGPCFEWLREWLSNLKRCRKLFRQGQARAVFNLAYREFGFARFPTVEAPGKTRKIVYAARLVIQVEELSLGEGVVGALSRCAWGRGAWVG
jgi:hypothetical protein